MGYCEPAGSSNVTDDQELMGQLAGDVYVRQQLLGLEPPGVANSNHIPNCLPQPPAFPRLQTTQSRANNTSRPAVALLLLAVKREFISKF